MKCKLCQQNEADKKNTHYLTDAIIRTCLNQDGSKEREKGLFSEVSSDSGYTTTHIQRNTSLEKIDEYFGRPVSEEEIEDARHNPFSVNHVFCSKCEAIFTEIENKFISNILPYFRKSDLRSNETLEITELKDFRLFFYLQLWRTHICDSNFNLKEDIAEDLRKMILNYDSIELFELKKYPLSITYLETLGGDKEYTRNLVGVCMGSNPYIIIMNDFVIQFYDSESNISFYDLYGLNENKSFRKFINLNEDVFQVQIIHNKERQFFISEYMRRRSENAILQYVGDFKSSWEGYFGCEPSTKITKEFINKIVNGDFEAQKYSKKKISAITQELIQNATTNFKGKIKKTSKSGLKQRTKKKCKLKIKRKVGKGIITKRKVRKRNRRKFLFFGID